MRRKVTFLGATILASTTFLGAASAFATTVDELSQATTPVTAELTLKQDTTKPIPPKGEEGGGDQQTDLTGIYGIAYIPNTLSGEAQLNETGEQKIDLSNNNVNKYNVGVQDKTRNNNQNWVLKAQLTWTNDTNNYMAGTYISTTNGLITENKEGILSALTDSQVTGEENLNIGQTSEVEVMKATAGKTMNGVYNYQFQKPQLVIPNPENVAAGTYSGNINWNLVDAPEI